MIDDEAHRRCHDCGGDCPPELCGADGLGARLVFVCPRHGAQPILDPFSRLR